MDDIRSYVKNQYAKAIKNRTSCCGSGGCCCGTTGISEITQDNYDDDTLEKAPKKMGSQSFGCGNPFTEANIGLGETILDLGCGAGLDLFLASEMTGPQGKVIGLDMTDEMLATAAKNLKGIKNISLLKGHIEEMPVESGTVDVIISNCVINLSPDKKKVLKEAFRVLRPGGRFCVSDTVFLRPVTDRIIKNLAAWSGCISGALQEVEYTENMKEAGFEDIEVRRTRIYHTAAFPELSIEEQNEIDGALASAIIMGKKPPVNH